MSEKLPPNNVEAERAILGSALIDPGVVELLRNIVKPSDFFRQDYGIIWMAMLSLHASGTPPDLITLANWLEQHKQPARLGGIAQLSALTESVPTSVHAEHYAKIVRSLSHKRQLLSLAGHMAGAAYSDNLDAELQTIQHDLAMLHAEHVGQPTEIGGLLTADELLMTDWPEPIWIVPGILPIGLNILAGRPKVGKSWLALQIAQAIAAGGKTLDIDTPPGPVLYLALEDPTRRIADRMKRQNWINGLRAKFMGLGHFQNEIGDLRNGGCQRLSHQIKRDSCRFIVIDTLSRATPGDQNETDTMTHALAPLQEMSHERECAIMMIDHHNKLTGANCMDVIANISGSTAKGAVADSIWGIYREGGKTGAKLIVTGRDVIDQSIPVQMDWSTGCWQRDQDAEGLKLTGRRQEILDALEVLGQQVGVTEIALEVGQDKGNTYKRLQDLVSAGLVTRSEKGGDVYYSL